MQQNFVIYLICYIINLCTDDSGFSFRFQSSFEDHNTRHSWILGLWCHCCFETVCTHITETGSTCMQCSACAKKSSEKRAYLRARGLNKSQKLGAVKVFYNQCQFVEHMKMHRLSTVNMGDLMLMPLPVNMSNSDWSSEFEIVCEVIMERAFLLRIHIIDWLKTYNLQDNWWKLVNGKSNDSMINKIVKGYQGRQLFKTCDNLTADMFTNFSSNVTHSVDKSSLDIEFIDNNSMDKSTNSYSDSISSDKNILENEDNPCAPTDITFVDCGPTSQLFEPEIPMNYARRRQVTAQEIKDYHLANANANEATMNNKTKNEAFNRNPLETDIVHKNTIAIKASDNDLIKVCSNKNLKSIIKPSLEEYVQFVKKTTGNHFSQLITDIRKISDKPIKISIPVSANKSIITKTNLNNSEQNLQTAIANNNSKVLTIQDSKNIASIISQLPSHLISNKKVVVIGQDSCNVVVHSGNEIITKKDLNNSIVDNGSTDSNISTQKMCDPNVKKQEVTGKIVIRNGKKYLIKRTSKNIITKNPTNSLSILKNIAKITEQPTSEHNTSKSSLSSTNSNEAKNSGMEQTASPHNISLLTPSPSPSELSSSSSCELHVKQTAIMPKLQKVPPHLISISAIQPTQKHILETISLIKGENGDLYMDIKVVDRIPKESFRDVCDVIIKHRREMLGEFYQMNSLELKERIGHLQHVSEEMEQVLNFISVTVFKEKLRSVNTLRCILEECLNKYNQDVQDEESDDEILEWETKVDPVHKCLSCDRFIKPKSYIPGFSKLSKNENAYCSCYKQVCHECLSYQGTTSRFTAHQNFHKKSKPYICPDCNFKCNSATSLEVHIWTVCFHTLRKITFTCKICEIDGFKDVESITRHFVIMHSKTKIGCEDCFRVFTSYSEYIGHCTETHPTKTELNPIRLVICKMSNVILRCENYMSYLQKYPGIRKLVWFKCPFCSLITTDNKHVTTLLNTHIRNNHVEFLLKVLSKEASTVIFGTKFLNAANRFLQQFSKAPEDMSANEISCMNDTVIPRIVNTRTISSEIFECGSQSTEYMWSTNSNENVNVSLQTMKKIDDKEKTELLPKIINVRSMNDLNSSKPEEIKFSTETKEKSNSLSLETITEDKKMYPLAHEETAMELDDSKEEIAKTKETDKDNNESTMNASCVSETPLIDTVDVRANSPNPSKKDSNSASETNTENRIKIVDFRKICKPDMEQRMIAEMCDTQKDENASCMASMPKPPPLSRIPQHLLEPIEINEPENELANDSKTKKPRGRRRVEKSKMRIALGTDTQKEGVIDYLCHLCNERIDTSQYVLQTHFREKHSDKYRLAVITPQLSRISPDFINGGYKQFVNNKKRKSDSALYTSKRKRRWTPRKHAEIKDVNPPVGLCVEQETAEDGEGNFICKKCGQRCANMPNLREHIAANHRLKGRYLICLECGENFVVAPSLQMHLKAFHGIEDPINYMNQNPSYAPDVDSDLQTAERTTVANQCYVCMAVFENKAAVDKHLRVHGMAFLNRKRIEARNALEKRANAKEDKPSIKDNPKEVTKQDKPVETILEKINVSN